MCRRIIRIASMQLSRLRILVVGQRTLSLRLETGSVRITFATDLELTLLI